MNAYTLCYPRFSLNTDYQNDYAIFIYLVEHMENITYSNNHKTIHNIHKLIQ